MQFILFGSSKIKVYYVKISSNIYSSDSTNICCSFSFIRSCGKSCKNYVNNSWKKGAGAIKIVTKLLHLPKRHHWSVWNIQCRGRIGNYWSLCFLFQSGRDSIIYNNNKNKSSTVFKSLSVVVVGVVDEGGDEGTLEDASAQEETTLDQLLPLDVRVVEVACIYQTKRDIASLMQHNWFSPTVIQSRFFIPPKAIHPNAMQWVNQLQLLKIFQPERHE